MASELGSLLYAACCEGRGAWERAVVGGAAAGERGPCGDDDCLRL